MTLDLFNSLRLIISICDWTCEALSIMSLADSATMDFGDEMKEANGASGLRLLGKSNWYRCPIESKFD